MEHFQTLLNHEEPLNPAEVEPSELNVRTGCITLIKTKNVIKKIKNGKAAGCDNIPPEAITAGGDTSGEVLLTSTTGYGVRRRYQRSGGRAC